MQADASGKEKRKEKVIELNNFPALGHTTMHDSVVKNFLSTSKISSLSKSEISIRSSIFAIFRSISFVSRVPHARCVLAINNRRIRIIKFT